VGHFALLDPEFEYGSGSTDLFESQDPMRNRIQNPGLVPTVFRLVSFLTPKFSCLQETKVITYKSLTMIKEKDGNHMEEIEEILCKDSRCNTYF
jgi:hypothetical protein